MNSICYLTSLCFSTCLPGIRVQFYLSISFSRSFPLLTNLPYHARELFPLFQRGHRRLLRLHRRTSLARSYGTSSGHIDFILLFVPCQTERNLKIVPDSEFPPFQIPPSTPLLFARRNCL